jgi:magnesium-transporting ATPase (P-type)
MNNNQANNAGNSWGLIIWQFLSLLIVAFVLTSFFHRQIKEMAAPIRKEELWSRMAFGLVSALLNVFAIGIVFITIIGMPLALMILFTYVIFIIIALTILPILLGKLFNRQFKLYSDDDRHLIYDFVLGFILMRIIALVPVLGFFVLLLFFLFAFGRVTQYIYAALSANRKSA